jgi:putative membrane protein insertion efficiency factor
MIGLVRGYQLTLSALIGRRCRYLPTCSDYAMEAIARHGAWRGAWLGAGRVCRCHPWGGDGFDPVPDKLPPGWRVWRRDGRH